MYSQIVIVALSGYPPGVNILYCIVLYCMYQGSFFHENADALLSPPVLFCAVLCCAPARQCPCKVLPSYVTGR
jgi:hypothetical protein